MMNPNPFFESNHLTVPVGMAVLPVKPHFSVRVPETGGQRARVRGPQRPPRIRPSARNVSLTTRCDPSRQRTDRDARRASGCDAARADSHRTVVLLSSRDYSRNGAFFYWRERLNSTDGEINQFRQLAQAFLDLSDRDFTDPTKHRPHSGRTYGEVDGRPLTNSGSAHRPGAPLDAAPKAAPEVTAEKSLVSAG